MSKMLQIYMGTKPQWDGPKTNSTLSPNQIENVNYKFDLISSLIQVFISLPTLKTLKDL